MQKKLTLWFANSAGALLLAGAVALFMANWSVAGLIQPQDPLFMISLRNLFWIMGSISLVVALICLFARRIWLKAAMILWVVTDLGVYRIGLIHRENYHGLGVYLSSISNTFAISTGVASLMLQMGLVYLLVGGLLSLLWLWQENSKGYLKTICAHCGGHIAFSPQSVGQKIACPHCQAALTLQTAATLKMTCVLCGGNVEFPAHAMGQKISCPHCAKTITLLNPRPTI